MIVAEVTREIERHSVSEERRFGIKASAAAFRILSSGLYRDKAAAIVRELSTNAADSHEDAGHPERPFTVHLPNMLEPYFEVTDTGTGLSHEFMMVQFPTYFESTKTSSNRFTGDLGLGSKSPFCFVDSYTVTSRHDGTERSYAAYLNEEGAPAIAPLSEVPTNAASGVTITIPVIKPADHTAFAQAALRVLAPFKIRPEVVGGPDRFEFVDPPILLNGQGWRLYDDQQRGARAIMGNIAYPVNKGSIEALSEIAKRVLSAPIDIDFPIGALDHTAGREDLSYDAPTLAALERVAVAIEAEVHQVVLDRFAACTTEWEARSLYPILFGDGRFGLRILGRIDIEHDETPIFSHEFIIDLSEYPGLTVQTQRPGSRVGSLSRRDYGAGTHNSVLTVPAIPQVLLVRNDPKVRSVQARLSLYHKTARRDLLFRLGGDPEQIDRFFALLNGVRTIDLADLPVPPRQASVPLRVQRLSDRVRKGFHKELNGDCWSAATIADPTEGGFYVARRGYQVVQGVRIRANSAPIIEAAYEIGILAEGQVIYGMDRPSIAKLTKQGPWTELFAHITAAMQARIVDPATVLLATIQNEVAALESASNTAKNERYNHRAVGDLIGDPDHPLCRYNADYRQSETLHEKTNKAIRVLCQEFGLTNPRPHEQSLASQWYALCRQYPLMMCNRDWNAANLRHAVTYVRWCDEQAAALARSQARARRAHLRETRLAKRQGAG